MSYDRYEIPDGITPLVGYRGWLAKGGALWSVYPESRAVEWPVGKPLHSECLPPRRDLREDDRKVVFPPKHYYSPHLDCTCGIYALHEYPRAQSKTVKPWPPQAITGMIHGWGKIIVGDTGFRAQWAKPIALVSRRRNSQWPMVIEALAERYGLEVVDYREVRK